MSISMMDYFDSTSIVAAYGVCDTCSKEFKAIHCHQVTCEDCGVRIACQYCHRTPRSYTKRELKRVAKGKEALKICKQCCIDTMGC